MKIKTNIYHVTGFNGCFDRTFSLVIKAPNLDESIKRAKAKWASAGIETFEHKSELVFSNVEMQQEDIPPFTTTIDDVDFRYDFGTRSLTISDGGSRTSIRYVEALHDYLTSLLMKIGDLDKLA